MPPDPVVVERLIAGTVKAPHVRREDRDAAIRELARLGLTPAEIGTRLGTTSTIVRTALRRPAKPEAS